MSKPNHDVVFVGGGLANALAAYRLHRKRPDLKLCLLERASELGGNHTWSFHHLDLSPGQLQWLQPFVVHSWARQQVHFPAYARVSPRGYASITSERLRDVVAAALGPVIRLGCDVRALSADTVTLDGGETITGRCIIDGRGAEPHPSIALGFQKFLGRELITTRPHGLTAPVIMDATVSQEEGYRFVYLLPFAADRILVEDTYYSASSSIEVAGVRGEIGRYVQSNGWEIRDVAREEKGVLPIALAGDIDAFWHARRRVAPVAYSGMRAALFHPTTGYSLPDAVRLADELAARFELTTAAVAAFVEEYSKRLWHERSFFRLLNRMLFLAAEQSERRGVMERFYRLPDDLIARFYAGAPTALDKARILFGKPPVSMRRAIACLPQSSAQAHARQAV